MLIHLKYQKKCILWKTFDFFIPNKTINIKCLLNISWRCLRRKSQVLKVRLVNYRQTMTSRGSIHYTRYCPVDSHVLYFPYSWNREWIPCNMFVILPSYVLGITYPHRGIASFTYNALRLEKIEVDFLHFLLRTYCVGSEILCYLKYFLSLKDFWCL